jgi:hypothetical protein
MESRGHRSFYRSQHVARVRPMAVIPIHSSSDIAPVLESVLGSRPAVPAIERPREGPSVGACGSSREPQRQNGGLSYQGMYPRGEVQLLRSLCRPCESEGRRLR